MMITVKHGIIFHNATTKGVQYFSFFFQMPKYTAIWKIIVLVLFWNINSGPLMIA